MVLSLHKKPGLRLEPWRRQEHRTKTALSELDRCQGLLGHMLLLASNGCDDHGEFADLREVDGGTSCRSKFPSAATDGTENAHPARCHDHLNRGSAEYKLNRLHQEGLFTLTRVQTALAKVSKAFLV